MAAAKPKDPPALDGAQKVMEEGDAVARFILDTIDQVRVRYSNTVASILSSSHV